MKISKKTLSTLLWVLALSVVIGTVAWEILERLLALAGIALSLSVGPVGFDAYVLAVSLRLNPGSLIGLVAGYLLFRRI
jgi:hypothetical protein